jgi:DNA-binding NtrC family response regulator
MHRKIAKRLCALSAPGISVPIPALAHRDLQQLMMDGQFRKDLYYRLHVVHIESAAQSESLGHCASGRGLSGAPRHRQRRT